MLSASELGWCDNNLKTCRLISWKNESLIYVVYVVGASKLCKVSNSVKYFRRFWKAYDETITQMQGMWSEVIRSIVMVITCILYSDIKPLSGDDKVHWRNNGGWGPLPDLETRAPEIVRTPHLAKLEARTVSNHAPRFSHCWIQTDG